MKEKIPTYIITGFLGSGKTTFLQNLLTYCKEKDLRAAIVINEIGETNVEGDLFKEDHVLEMLNGCICCSIQDDFTKELYAFIHSISDAEFPDLILVEGTGIANPLEIVDALTDPLLIDELDLYSIINLVDASKYLEYQSIFSSSKEVRTVLKSQISASSFLILNKMDLINQKNNEKVRKKIEQLKKADSPIVETSYGNVCMEEALKKRIAIHRSIILKPNHKCGCNKGVSCPEHAIDSHNHTFQALKINVSHPIDRIELEKWLNRLPKTLIRGKGIVKLVGSSDYFQFQYSSNQLKVAKIKNDASIEPCIILIGVDVEVETITASFHESFNKHT